MQATEKKEIARIEEQSNQMVERGKSIVIDSAETMQEATEILSQANKAYDAMKAKKDEVMRPILDAAAAERKRWKPLEDMFKEVIAHVRDEMSRYQTEQLKKKQEEDAKIAARVGSGKGKLKPETAIKKMEENHVDEKVETGSGQVSFKEKKQLKIVDAKKVPQEYWVIDEDAVFEALKEGKVVPGAEIEIIQVPINRR